MPKKSVYLLPLVLALIWAGLVLSIPITDVKYILLGVALILLVLIAVAVRQARLKTIAIQPDELVLNKIKINRGSVSRVQVVTVHNKPTYLNFYFFIKPKVSIPLAEYKASIEEIKAYLIENKYPVEYQSL